MELPKTREEVEAIAEVIAQKLGLRASIIRKELGLKMVSPKNIQPPTTLEEAKDRFKHSGSEEKEIALEEWKKLANEKIETASTLDEINRVLNLCPDESKEQKKAFKKCEKLSAEELKKASTLYKIKQIFTNSPIDSKGKKKALKKLKKTSLKKIKEASTFDELIEMIYEYILHNEKGQKLAIKKCLRLCSSPDEARKLYYSTLFNNRMERKQILIKWVGLCSTIDSIKEVRKHILMLSDNELREMSSLKWVELCSTAKEIQEVFDHSPNKSKEKRMALLKWISLS